MSEISNYYNTQKHKTKIIEEFFEKLRQCLVLTADSRIYAKEGYKYLHFIRYKDLEDWNVRNKIYAEVSTSGEALLSKIQYMSTCGHSSIVDIVEMLKRIVTKGTKGCYKGRGENLETFIECKLSILDAKQSEINKIATGHFHFNWGNVYLLNDKEIRSIKRLLQQEDLL